ncbi:MAG: hypothetical protein AB7O47_10720 [Flavobacteriales bacterium]
MPAILYFFGEAGTSPSRGPLPPMVLRQCKMINFDQKMTKNAVMKLMSRHRNGRHASRPEKDLIFAPSHFLKRTKNKKELPPLNFLSRFLSNASFSTFAVYIFLCVGKITHKKILATPPAAKELNPPRKTKNTCQKILPARWSFVDKFVHLDTFVLR